MMDTSSSIWSRSLMVRLMSPVGLMLLLVVMLGMVSLGTRGRLHQSYDDLTQGQEVRTALTEARSISRSLQRDALNLTLDDDPAELATLQTKFADRRREFRSVLSTLVANPRFAGGNSRTQYLRSQTLVLQSLAGVADLAARGERSLALRRFRAEVRPNERAASKIADRLILEQNADVAAMLVQAQEAERHGLTVGITASVLLFVLAAAAAFVIARNSVLRPLSDIEDAIGRVADGDTAGQTPHIHRQDEIGLMARAIEVFRESVRERERLRAERERRLAEQVEAEHRREQQKRLLEEQALARSRAIARSAADLHGEVHDVLGSLRHAAETLKRTAVRLADLSKAASGGFEQVDAAVSRAAEGATDIAAATSQFIRSIADISESTRRSANLSADVSHQSEVAAARMERVQRSAASVDNAVSLIAGIAKRTNLLALNASIEAARGGEAGRGFGVVANEVKALAAQTAAATEEVAGQISEMQQVTVEAVDSLSRIAAMVSGVAHGSELLAATIDEQARSGQVISRNVDGTAADLDLIASGVGEVGVAAHGVDQLAATLKGDADLLENSATTISRALAAFFQSLEQEAPALATVE